MLCASPFIFFEGEEHHSHSKKIRQAEFLFFAKIFFGTTLDKHFRHKKPVFSSEIGA